MKRTVSRIILATAVAPVAVLALSACSGSGMPGMDHGTTTTTPMMGGHSAADVEFAQMMIAHHQQAVDMATLAETRATDPEIKTLAAQIKTAQQPEITTMAGWLSTWGQPTAQAGGHNMPGMGAMPGMMSNAEMGQLQADTGVDFDRMFARMMIAHHNGAIQMATDVKTKGSNADVKAMADRVITTQKAEVDTLQTILDRL